MLRVSGGLCVLFAVWGCGGKHPPQPEPPPAERPASADDAPTCAGKGSQPLDGEWTLTSGGLERTVLVHVPPSYDPGRPMPVVIDLHGYMADAAAQQQTSRMLEAADAEGFIALHPNGTGNPKSWNGGPCCGAPPSEVDDVQFIRDALAMADERLCVDTSRVYATGYSNGAFMAHRLACELSDRITAIAPVGGPLLDIDCEPGRPVSVLQFHGDADTFVPYEGNPSLGYPPIDDTMAAWAARNGCGTQTEEVFASGDAVCRAFVGCPDEGAVVSCVIAGGGHTWPGGADVPELGKTTHELSATAYMWTFFSRLQPEDPRATP